MHPDERELLMAEDETDDDETSDDFAAIHSFPVVELDDKPQRAPREYTTIRKHPEPVLT